MFIVVQPTGFATYCYAQWSDGSDNWVVQRAYAKKLTRREAQRIVDKINASRPVNRAHIEPIKENCPCAHAK
jgi:hypothetical protein